MTKKQMGTAAAEDNWRTDSVTAFVFVDLFLDGLERRTRQKIRGALAFMRRDIPPGAGVKVGIRLFVAFKIHQEGRGVFSEVLVERGQYLIAFVGQERAVVPSEIHQNDNIALILGRRVALFPVTEDVKRMRERSCGDSTEPKIGEALEIMRQL